MKRKIYILILILLIGVLASCKQKAPQMNPEVSEENNSNVLQILKSDYKFTQDQLLSRIKAEYLIENNGYSDDDEVTVILNFTGNALIDEYNNAYYKKYNSVASFAESIPGQNKLERIRNNQAKVLTDVINSNLIIEVVYKYDTILNGVAVKTKYKNIEYLKNINGVESVTLSDTYNRPQDSEVSDVANIINEVDIYDTGIFDSSSVTYTGAGTSVAVLDSGFDCSHSVFQTEPERVILTKDDIANILDDTNAKKFTTDLEINDVYYSSKIPFIYDYADKDSDVFPYDSEHGTHVAGIIGGKDDVITGVAINTQLVLMKVFPDLDTGANTEDILAALEDAVLLGVDAINMSLGSSCGFTREEDGSHINEVYDKINESGISLITAASNSYSSGYGGAQGNTNLVTNPDSGTVGSPSTYEAALSVASISGVKSKYLIANDTQVLFFNESNSITAEPNDFFKEIGLKEGETKTYEYVTIPGVGLKVNFTTVGDITGKIALIERGDNTFEEKALNAKTAGAIACIIYNNVDGDILMSMGKTDHIPTISISKDDGTILASRESGTITLSYSQQAGPFMSDFSSWGPSPNLELKPEITAHGGEIKSAVPGGDYDELSGTSMATPNLTGIVILIKQYLKDTYPTLSMKEITVLTNQLLMSTATIVKNEQANPYSPRKQGAGLASIYNVVNTKGYITVDGIDRSKLDLYDDPTRSGVYEMKFNIVNLSSDAISYDIDLIGMTESVSTSDAKHVAEKDQILHSPYTVNVIEGGTLNGNKITVNPNATCKVELVYTLTDTDKNLIDSLFPYGMYVEGFITLDSADNIDLSIPFLAFYGDWLEAPMFDKTYYEVEAEAHDDSIDEEDKVKADYYATTPYGSYFYNYIIPLGTYLYDVDTTKYDAIPASLDHIAISNSLGTIDGIGSVYAGLLRGAKEMRYTIVDKVTCEEVYNHVDYNANKAYSNGGTPFPYFDYFKIKSYDLDLVNNREYEFKMQGILDYKDGGLTENVRNTFSFDFTLDDEAPILKECTYEKVYDKSLKKDRYYLTMTIYDNQYAMSITPIIFTSSSSYTYLSKDPIPVYSTKGSDNVVRFEITEYLEEIFKDEVMTSALAFSIDDYALNSNIYLCQLPGTKGEFKFTKDGTTDGIDLSILSVYEDEVVDLTKYLSTKDSSVDENKDYLKYLVWESSNDSVVEVSEGLIKCIAPGKATITVSEQLDLNQAILIINVKERCEKQSSAYVEDGSTSTIKNLRFSYFDTEFAYSRAAQTSEIGETGDRTFISGLGDTISFYPGEKIKLGYDFDPWYALDNYELTYESTNPTVATVDETGLVTALKKGNTNIVLSVNGSNLMAKIKISVKSEFVIENRILVAYKGLGGEVVIPDDEGILYIGSYAFCLYDTDRSIELTDDDYDANKIPSMNTTVTKVVIPEGVEEIQKYAFYNCSGLREVVIPDSVKFIRDCAFRSDKKLETIDISHVLSIGREAFRDCTSLVNVDFSKAYAIGAYAFCGCKALESIDLTNLRNAGREAFKDCTSLKDVVMTKDTALSYAMFVNTGLEIVDIYEPDEIPSFCFAKCENLTTVNIHNSLYGINDGAFSECDSLVNFNILGNIEYIGEQVFYKDRGMEKFVLPNCSVKLGNYCFYRCEKLSELVFQENSVVTKFDGAVFGQTILDTFTIDENNKTYQEINNVLTTNNGKNIVLAKVNYDYSDLVIDSTIEKISSGAFAGANMESLTIQNKNLIIAEYAFAVCPNLTTINFPSESGLHIDNYAFYDCEKLNNLVDFDKVTYIGEYAFSKAGLENITIGSRVTVLEGAFFQSNVEKVTIGANTTFGLGAFQECAYLEEVVMPDDGGVHFGVACFANDKLLSKLDFTKVDEEIEKEAFYGCTSLKVANLENVKIIGDYAFADCGSLYTVTLPIVEELGEGAFGRYDQSKSAPIIEHITLPNTLTKIGDGVFLGCTGLVEVVLPDSLNELSNYLFAYCTNLERVQIPANVTEIGEYDFYGNLKLAEVNLDNITTIGDYAFLSCEVLDNINLSKVTTIGYGAFGSCFALSGTLNVPNLTTASDYAFQGTIYEEVNAPKLKVIGEGAFSNCTNLKEFILSSDIESIGVYPFNGASSLEKIGYAKDGNTLYDGVINDYALVDNGILYIYLKSGNMQLQAVPENYNIEKLIVKEGTVRIDTYACGNNKHITSIVFPDSLQYIGNYAFYGVDNLELVEFKSFQAPLLEDWYNYKSVLEETDPGYDLLHQHFDIYGLELYYYNFVDLVGKNKPMKMVVPANEDIVGYDAISYIAYFGGMESAIVSDYVAMDSNMKNFLELAKKLDAISVLTMSDEQLVNDCVNYLNRVKQDPTKYGVSKVDWDRYSEKVTNAKEVISSLKITSAGQKIIKLQEKLKALPETFDIAKLDELASIYVEVNELSRQEKQLLDLTNYTSLINSYNDYVKGVKEEAEQVVNLTNNSFVVTTLSITFGAISLIGLGLIILKVKKEA